LIQPPNGSVCGTPSRISSARLDALPPSARRVAPCEVGLADRASERRKSWKPGTSRRISSSRPDAEPVSRSRPIRTLLYALSPAARGRPRR
jgi:hypothetical protein